MEWPMVAMLHDWGGMAPLVQGNGVNLTSDHPYWTLKNGILANYPPLGSSQTCDVLVLGCGITGALVAEALTSDGHDVVMLDARDVGRGSTSASTAMLQYEVDTHLIELIDMHGRQQAELAYRACHESIDLLDGLISSLGIECGFTRKESVYLASRSRDVSVLKRECAARRAIGIEVEEWSGNEVRERFGFSRPGALHSVQAAEVDAYRLTNGLLSEVWRRGGRIFDRTAVTRIDHEREGVIARTSRGAVVRAKRIVVAMGYETQSLFDTAEIVKLHSSFALASEPMPADRHWWRRCLLWETARPYFYLRTDTDDRIIMGGGDVPFRTPALRDKLLPGKTRKLEKHFADLFPAAGMETAYSWAGTFAETKDGLAYIGSHRNHPLCLFALGFGGNGISYSIIAAEILRRQIVGQGHTYSEVFRFDR